MQSGKVQVTTIELSILRALANGMHSKEIAGQINRRTATVELHVRMLFIKYNARSRAHLVALALRDGELQSTDIDPAFCE